MRSHLFVLPAFLACTAVAFAQQVSPSPPPTPPALKLDTIADSVGIAQAAAHSKGLQARILWMDAGANVGNLNSEQKIEDVVAKVKSAGMNIIVLDVKPIVGYTVYPSRYAPRLTDWKGQHVDPSLDVLRAVLTAAHAAGLLVYANMSTFGEGHKFVKQGLAYTHPDWQTILYEQDRTVYAGVGNGIKIAPVGTLPDDESVLGLTVSGESLPKAGKAGLTVAVLNFNARVVGLYEDTAASAAQIPANGSALIGYGRAGEWLRRYAAVGSTLVFKGQPRYVPVADAPEQVYTMFCDPDNPDVREHEWDMVREIVTNYDVDGVIFDDRLRYAGLNADFGPASRQAFEAEVGRKLTWPDEVFRWSALPGRDIVPGPYYSRWLAWRAEVITSWLSKAAAIVRGIRPTAQVAVYVGSWYGDYDEVGSNWAGPDFSAPYDWMTADYRRTAYAGLLDWLTTGCYYYPPSMASAVANGDPPGETVEGAGLLSSLVVSDAAWTYAGIYALSYHGHPDAFSNALLAAGASSQGVMVFDMSQIIDYDWWPLLAAAFAGSPAQAPNAVPGLLDQVRRARADAVAKGVPPPALPPYMGLADTGW